jgi:predicted esterase
MCGRTPDGRRERPYIDVVTEQRTISRRSMLLGTMGVVASAALAACGSEDVEAPGIRATVGTGQAAPVTEGAFESRFRQAHVGWGVAVPKGVPMDSLPVLVFLHGLGGDHRVPFDYLHLDRDLQVWADAGGKPFAVATVDGGEDWWKPLPGGTDAGRMVVDEFVPLLRDRGLDVDTLALGGASMGGYGALRLAGGGRLRPRSVSVIAPALGDPIGRSGSLTDVSQHPELLRGVPVQLSVGDEDAFRDDDLAYADALRKAGVTATSSTFPGGHSHDAMETFGPNVIDFAGQHLS